ncbi:PaaI family thioesterase [Agrobacterium larrymoorei]|uniref:PaaI family thioesterase n=1 Tax=Agrobacterium larrymoorei TaxID=160699 RepID=A0AAF0HFV0_9HYPH|nr:PaaI family thioesterase [Agrobacterium larrymoorei]WHA44105.1 PaaI family thioesterase [Agrobacterium larrymoorei]
MQDDIETWSALEDDGFIGLVGPILACDQDPFRYRFDAVKKHRNRGGFVQGGMLMTFADRAMGTAARNHDPGRQQSTVQFDMQFMRAVRIGEVVDIRCEVLKETRTLIFLEGKLTVAGEIVAAARGVWKIIQR